MLLENKTAIVTGAGSGIGRAIALFYAREGANVVVSDISEKGGQETVKMIGDQYKSAESIFVRADVGKAEDHEALVTATLAKFGSLHIACNNAGITGEKNEIGNYSLDGWRRTIEINLSGVFYAMHYQLPRIVEAGGGSVVNMASILGQVSDFGIAGYVASKHGVVGLTKVAALDYATRGVRVNTVAPGYIETPLLGGQDHARQDDLISRQPIGRLGTSEEVAELVVWLSSDKASFVTGAYYNVDGGYLLK
jgi:NAD(P)-dependent dehydrogenase (short-subunit alcohol dehydrogenase family)